jgi:ribonuclease VapC
VLAQRLEQEGILYQTLEVVPYTFEDSFDVATLRVATESLGLSLGDRVCLALGKKLGLPVLTADTLWKKVNV